MQDRTKRWTVVLAAVLLIVAAVVAAGAVTRDSDPDGDVTKWHTEDGSSDPVMSPAAFVSQQRPIDDPDGKVRHYKTRNHTGHRHRRPHRSLGGAVEWCRVARGTVYGGNVWPFDKLVSASISRRFCYKPATGNITELGRVAVSCAVSTAGETFLWHCDGPPRVAVNRSGNACDGTICWEYHYDRGEAQWARGYGPATQHADSCVSITLRGTGRVIIGRCAS